MGVSYTRYAGEGRLDNKTAIITGCNCGIGKYTAMDFYKRGCRVIMACRDENRAQIARNEIIKETLGTPNVGQLVIRTLNLASLNSVKDFAKLILDQEKEINILVNNAGVVMCPKSVTEDGFELQFGTNHLGHFLLTVLLLPLIIRSAPARIVNVSSITHKLADPIDWDNLNAEKSYGPLKNYYISKLANVWFTRELARRLEGSGVTTYAVHPGLVHTNATRHFDHFPIPGFRWFCDKIAAYFIDDASQGSSTTIYCAIDPKTASETGLYYERCQTVELQGQAKDDSKATKMWEVSAKLVGLGDFDPFTPQSQK